MNKQINKILIIAIMLSSLVAPVYAEESVVGYSFSTPEPALFSVTIPSSSPIYVDGYGNVTTSENAVIINNSNDAIQVVNLELQPMSEYIIVDYDENFRAKKINSKQFAMNINGSKTQQNGSFLFNSDGFGMISSGSVQNITYRAKATLSSEQVSNLHIANIIFTIDWYNPITLTYDANGGSFTGGNTINNMYYTNHGNLIEGTYKDPQRRNCTFAGWYTDKDFKNELNIDSLTKNTTVYAKWLSEYKATHSLQELWNSSSYALDVTETLIGVVDKPVSPPVKYYDNYSSPAVQTVILNDSGNFVVAYKYNRKDYWLDVNYIVDGVYTGGPSDWDSWPSKLSNDFMSVYINGNYSGGGRDYCKTQKFEYSYEIRLYNLPDSYYYAGTYEEGADYWDNGTTLYRQPDKGIMTENVGARLIINTITPNMSKYTIVFNANGGQGTMNSMTMVFDENNSEVDWLPANTFTRSGYTFAGWTTNANGTGTVYEDMARVQSLSSQNGAIVTLYAKWTTN